MGMWRVTKYRKKPVVIEAMQFDGTEECARSIVAWIREPASVGGVGIEYAGTDDIGEHPLAVTISTLEGEMRADPGDWIIKGVKGEFYPCKPDIFAATYEPADD